MRFLVIMIAYLVSKCIGLDLEHNCTFKNEIIPSVTDWGYPKPGDMPMLNRKIIGGVRVSIVEHPYVVSIRRQMAHYLTGTLIGGNLVATVAHPLVDVPIVELSVVTGQNYNDRGSFIYTVILVIFHENFDRSTLHADLALIRVHELYDYKMTVKMVKNVFGPDYNLENNLVSAFVTGWGRCDLTGNELCLPRASVYYRDEYLDPMLRSITVQIKQKNKYCDIYEKHEVHIGAGMMCVGPARQEDHTCPCLAVPGAPLVAQGKLLGLLSWGFGCGYHTDLPLIYTDVRAYHGWIVQSIHKFAELEADPFQQLFDTTKMAITTEWLSATKRAKVEHEHPDIEIQPWKIDKELAFLNGDIYDIRDYYGGREYHEEKMRRYELIRASAADDVRPRPTSRQSVADHTHMSYEKQYRLQNTTEPDSEYENDYDALDGNPYTDPNGDDSFLTMYYTTTQSVPYVDEEYF